MDSQTLEVLVAKIDAMVESAEALDDASGPVTGDAPTAAPDKAPTPATSAASSSTQLAAQTATNWPIPPMAATASPDRKEAPRAEAAPRWPITPRSKPPATDRAPERRSPPAESVRARLKPTAPSPAVPPAARPQASTPPAIAAKEEAPASNVPAFDSTQTLRALTPLELQDGQSSKSFAIQLSLSEEPIHPEHIPNLDIFDAYRLYVVTGIVEERVMHALRLGFFSSETAAEAVAGYLKMYFDTPAIKRISLAEHDRFQERRVAARKDVGDNGKHAAIELTSRPPLPERRAKIDVATSPANRARRPSGHACSSAERTLSH